MRKLVFSRPTLIAAAVLLAALLAKFTWTLFVYNIPLGYDPGIYRYLFLSHAQGFPPFQIAPMDTWAYEHPLGLFFFSSILMKLGLPVDWLIGWMWNFVPVVLIALLAWVTAQREGENVAPFVLIAGLLSAAFYDGFSGMYWKTYAALFFVVLTFALLDRRSWWAAVPAFFTLVTHSQTGLLLALVLFSWWLISFRMQRKNVAFKRNSLIAVCVIVLATLFYIPIWQQGIGKHLEALFSTMGDPEAGGNFPPPMEYIRVTGLLFIAGLYGFYGSLVKGKVLTPWHLAVLWSAVFVVFRLLFYKRFFIHLDFFLLPFAAMGIAKLWQEYDRDIYRACLIVMILVQGFLSAQVMLQRTPDIDKDTFALIRDIEQHLPPHGLVMALENASAPWIRGWAPLSKVGGPGVFRNPWNYGEWERFLLGTSADREEMVQQLPKSTLFVVTPIFVQHYGESAIRFIDDPCFEKIPEAPLLKITCSRR